MKAYKLALLIIAIFVIGGLVGFFTGKTASLFAQDSGSYMDQGSGCEQQCHDMMRKKMMEMMGGGEMGMGGMGGGMMGGKGAQGSMDMDSMVSELKKTSDSDFDRKFIELMIPHHKGAIDMATEALTRAQHQEIRDLARQIIDSQSGEIQKMREWKTQWGGE